MPERVTVIITERDGAALNEESNIKVILSRREGELVVSLALSLMSFL